MSAAWLEVKDGNPVARELFHRHYSYRPRRRLSVPVLFVGPGEKLVLLHSSGQALFIWRKFISNDGQQGVNCAAFRNEGAGLSSELIRQAEEFAHRRWPGARLFTYVDPRRIQSRNPGCCFKKAGWRRAGTTKDRGLVILERVA